MECYGIKRYNESYSFQCSKIIYFFICVFKQLEIVASGNSTDKEYALAIIPVRQSGNFLLCTLLLGNVAVNAALSILLTALSGGILAFIISTALIVIFGEIIPQATCSRYTRFSNQISLFNFTVEACFIYRGKNRVYSS